MILHIDMDAFFAAVEQRDNPALRGKPVIISGNSKRSVVSTASYEARKYGIRSAMPVFKAKEKCRHLIIVPGNMQKYRLNSQKIMEILSEFSPQVEQVSIDEAYMDISGCERLFGSPEQMSRQIKTRIFDTLSLTCSIGVAPLKFLSKIASDMQKPDGFTIIRPSEVTDFINQLPIKKVPGVGKRAMQQMVNLQINTLGDVKKFSLEILNRKFGKMGTTLWRLSQGNDSGTVQTEGIRKSISSETTLSEDIFDPEQIKQILLDRSQSVGRQLRKKKLYCQTVFIKLKFSDFSQITRSNTSEIPICASNAIFDRAVSLMQKVTLKKKIRLIGVGVGNLKDESSPFQMPLLQTRKTDNKQWESVDHVLDTIDERYGSKMVCKASLRLNPRRWNNGNSNGR